MTSEGGQDSLESVLLPTADAHGVNSGHDSAALDEPTRWTAWSRARDAFRVPTDPDWDVERRRHGDLSLSDPWER